MEVYTFSQWVLFFYIYCFLGWLFECTYVSIKEKHWVNRGFLKGPLLPIYGSGAICILIVTIPFRDSVPLMCLVGMAAAAVLEYVTGAVMERLFRVRYWDYSDRFLNLNGYICLASVLCWSVMTILVVDVIQVRLERLVLAVDEQITANLVFVITPFVTADVVTSFHAAMNLRNILIQWDRVREEIEKLNERRLELEKAMSEGRRELNERRQELEALMKAAGERAGEKVSAQMREITDRAAVQQDLSARLAAVQEKTNRLAAESEIMHRLHGKSIRGLLKRNPRAISYRHRDAFAALKQSAAKHLGAKKDGTDEEESTVRKESVEGKTRQD
ncbi:MAG: hypothetical protein LIO94_08095 [Clostridiales bacterium]|nr:hypothetical protein [Clostridiales bacterium]